MYIKATDVPDYWWDGTTKQQLETQKVDLSNYQEKINDLDTIRSGASAGATALQSYTETDPTVPNHVKGISESDISNWNSKSTFSGSYNDLTDKPTIPTVPTNVSAFTNDAGYLTEHQRLQGYATESWVEGKGYLTSHQDISGKVDKVEGKELSTNDFTNDYKSRLDTLTDTYIKGLIEDGTEVSY